MASSLLPSSSDHSFFLPDFCAVSSVLVVVLVAELLALVLTLLSVPGADFWSNLSLISLFVQWVALTSAALLCISGPLMKRLPSPAAAVFAWALMVGVCGVISALVYYLPTEQLLSLPLADFVLRNLAVSAIIGAVLLRYLFVQYQGRRNLELESRARIQALQSRIRPHFLFNSMNTIASLTRSDPRTAEKVVEDLADLFRISLGDAADGSSLLREMRICEQYLDIEKLRLGERLQVHFDARELPDCPLPALILQPVVENAVYHGIEPAASGGQIRISASISKSRCRVVVQNSLPEDNHNQPRSGNHMALDNVKQRLQVFFDGQARVRTDKGPALYCVELEFPVREAGP